MDAIIRPVTRVMAPLKRRVLLMIRRGVLKLVDDGSGLQHVQLVAFEGETLDQVERFQEYGFTSVPHPGAEAVLAAVSGARAHSLVVGVEDRRFRLTGLAGGDVAIYDDRGQKMHLTRDGINIVSPGKINITAPAVCVEAKTVELAGTGGQKIARAGDLVEIKSGSSAGRWPIVTGSEKVKAN